MNSNQEGNSAAKELHSGFILEEVIAHGTGSPWVNVILMTVFLALMASPHFQWLSLVDY